ncbi:MAG TPA: hypothetical protein VMV97_05620 [Sulfuriferula sp.]|nr:hypothetical protein [Sulfuriferula sp.]
MSSIQSVRCPTTPGLSLLAKAIFPPELTAYALRARAYVVAKAAVLRLSKSVVISQMAECATTALLFDKISFDGNNRNKAVDAYAWPSAGEVMRASDNQILHRIEQDHAHAIATRDVDSFQCYISKLLMCASQSVQAEQIGHKNGAADLSKPITSKRKFLKDEPRWRRRSSRAGGVQLLNKPHIMDVVAFTCFPNKQINVLNNCN